MALAERLVEIIPCAEQVRFTCSGTETTWHAVRVARAFTGKQHVITFERHFHGFNDTLAFSFAHSVEAAGPADAPNAVCESEGVPPRSAEHVTVLPFNDLEAVERAVRSHADDLATVILEPINYDCFGIAPEPGYLEGVRDLTRRAGAVLIFDEFLSGFRGLTAAHTAADVDAILEAASAAAGAPRR